MYDVQIFDFIPKFTTRGAHISGVPMS